MIILDTCVWIAFLNKEDSQNSKAEEVFEQIDLSKVFLPNMVFFEILTVIRVKIKDKNILVLFMNLLNYAGAKPQSDEILHSKTVKKMTGGESHRLSFVDALLVSYFEEGYEVITFDEELGRELKKKR